MLLCFLWCFFMVDSVPEIIKELVKRFDRNKHIYKSSSYDEENTKIEFINPFFEALGWDVHHKKNTSARFKDVVFEDTIHIGGKAKAPDYSFRIGVEKIFFVEAKKPSVDIKQDKKSAFQIRRYGWSAKLGLCILTNFEELAVYETKTKPDKIQNAGIGRIKYYKYTDYVEKWNEIVSIFSRNAVLTGEFDNFVTGHQGIKKGTSEVDDEFLKEIENWRLILAKNIALRNKITDVKTLFEDALTRVAQAFKVPVGLIRGDVAGIKEAYTMLLTNCIDPIAHMISEEFTYKMFSEEQIINGYAIEADTTCIKHIDIFDLASSIDKLIASGFLSIDEVRTKAGLRGLGEDWSEAHYMTLNYTTAEAAHENGGNSDTRNNNNNEGGENNGNVGNQE